MTLVITVGGWLGIEQRCIDSIYFLMSNHNINDSYKTDYNDSKPLCNLENLWELSQIKTPQPIYGCQCVLINTHTIIQH